MCSPTVRSNSEFCFCYSFAIPGWYSKMYKFLFFYEREWTLPLLYFFLFSCFFSYLSQHHRHRLHHLFGIKSGRTRWDEMHCIYLSVFLLPWIKTYIRWCRRWKNTLYLRLLPLFNIWLVNANANHVGELSFWLKESFYIKCWAVASVRCALGTKAKGIFYLFRYIIYFPSTHMKYVQ